MTDLRLSNEFTFRIALSLLERFGVALSTNSDDSETGCLVSFRDDSRRCQGSISAGWQGGEAETTSPTWPCRHLTSKRACTTTSSSKSEVGTAWGSTSTVVEDLWKYPRWALGFDQHQMDPCVFIVREPPSRWKAVRDDVLVIPPGDVGPPRSFCGILGVHVDDQINGGRGARRQLLAVGWSSRPFFRSSVPENIRDRHQTSQDETQRKNPTAVPLCSKATTTCPRLSTAIGWPDRHGQTSAAISVWHTQQCMQSPTVGQIRMANAWVRRARQSADWKLTFLSIPPERIRLVTQTDYSSNDPDGTGRSQNAYIMGATETSMAVGDNGTMVATCCGSHTNWHRVVRPRWPGRPTYGARGPSQSILGRQRMSSRKSSPLKTQETSMSPFVHSTRHLHWTDVGLFTSSHEGAAALQFRATVHSREHP